MGKFKVGDRVRLVKDGLSTTGAVGKLATIDSWNGVLQRESGEYLLKIDPPVDYSTLAVTPSYTQSAPDCFELVDAPLTIRGGKFYRTRDGHKVGPMVSGRGPWFEDDRGYSYYENGKRLADVYGDEIIAEWTDDPAATPASTTGFTVPMDAPEFGGGFKVGDRVETRGNFTFDPSLGTVARVPAGVGSLYGVLVDGHGKDYEWNYCASELRLVAGATRGKDDEPDALARFQLIDVFEAKEMARAGIFTINEVRKKFGLPPISSGDKLAA